MNVKILCTYHCGAPQEIHPFMLKYPDVFIPVLSGAVNYRPGSSKLFDTFIKDNDCENNLSALDGKFSEHTVIYWAYANYARLNNPDMIGVCQYRRFLDVDYHDLNKDVIYVRRSLWPTSEYARWAILNWGGGEAVVEYVLDEYQNRLPEYREATMYMLDDDRFYDKNMFIMSNDRFMEYMKYIVGVYNLLCDPAIIRQIQEWHNFKPYKCTHDYLFCRAMGVMLEILSGVYFQYLKIQGAQLCVAQPVKGSFVGY